MQILDGKLVAEARRTQIQQKTAEWTTKAGRAPGLAVILVGDDPASQVYVSGKLKACQQVGFASFEHRLAAETTPHQLQMTIESLNQNPAVDGILLQLPLPAHLAAANPLKWIAPRKDADCLTAENLGLLWSGRPRTTPCTPWGVMVILEHYGYKVAGLEAVVVGRSAIVGKPMAHLLTEANATVTVCHSRTRDLTKHTRTADLVVVAAGKPEFLGREDFRKGAIVIDVGIHRQPSHHPGLKPRLCGDVRSEELENHVAALTPVPGGVGPMTITMLMENTLRLAQQLEVKSR